MSSLIKQCDFFPSVDATVVLLRGRFAISWTTL